MPSGIAGLLPVTEYQTAWSASPEAADTLNSWASKGWEFVGAYYGEREEQHGEMGHSSEPGVYGPNMARVPGWLFVFKRPTQG